MKTKNEVEVLIGGEKYTICGYESDDYLQKIATYINRKSCLLYTSDAADEL